MAKPVKPWAEAERIAAAGTWAPPPLARPSDPLLARQGSLAGAVRAGRALSRQGSACGPAPGPAPEVAPVLATARGEVDISEVSLLLVEDNLMNVKARRARADAASAFATTLFGVLRRSRSVPR